jgi:hypothetical protein
MISKALIKEDFDTLAEEIAEKAKTDKETRDIILEVISCESALSFGRINFIRACAKLGLDTEEELLSLNSIDAVLERYSRFFT